MTLYCSHTHSQVKLNQEYNRIRPHSSLDYRPAAEAYEPMILEPITLTLAVVQ